MRTVPKAELHVHIVGAIHQDGTHRSADHQRLDIQILGQPPEPHFKGVEEFLASRVPP